jgi:uncharacterized protein (DUF2147 family)
LRSYQRAKVADAGAMEDDAVTDRNKEAGYRWAERRALDRPPGPPHDGEVCREEIFVMETADRASSSPGRGCALVWLRALHQLGRAALLIAAIAFLAVPGVKAQAQPEAQPQPQALAGIHQGVWLFDGKAAVDIFDCEGQLCGRIVWLRVPLNLLGQLDRDKNNPDPALRQRELCGQTIIWGLRPDGPDRWKDGWFYNPDDGVRYRFSARLKSADVLVARIYLLIPLFGQTKTLVRVSQGVTEGWCLALQPPSSTRGEGGSEPKAP